MKKYITLFVMAVLLAIMVPVLANTANAQTGYYYRNGHRVYYKKRSFYQRHRKALNVAGGAGGGALVGGLIGGRRGAGIGILAGGGGALLYNHKHKHRRYRRVVRNY